MFSTAKAVTSQRDIYKLLEKFTTGEFKTEIDFLKSLITDIVNHKDFTVIGGRVWQFHPDDCTYTLRFQYGNIKKITHHYTLPVEDYPVLSELHEKRTGLRSETDSLLKSTGIKVYSVTGVGSLCQTEKGTFYKYVLGFNAKELLQSFFETLNIISSVATMALRDLCNQQEQRKIQKDIDRASEIQRSLLPASALRFKDFDIHGICVPDSAVGGDYFDYILGKDDQEESVGILISDAVSKGLPAAIQALFVSGAVRMAMSYVPKISNMFSKLNNLIFDTFPFDDFVTMFYCELSLSSNRMVLYANAGHNAPMHYRPSSGKFSYLGSTGGLLGITKHAKYKVENKRMQKGDILVLYTDGITEAHDNEGEMFGEERLMALIRRYNDYTAKEMSEAIIEDVEKFSFESLYTDDKTIIVIKRDS